MSSRAVKRTYDIYITAVEAADLFAINLTVKIDFEFKVFNTDNETTDYRMYKWLVPTDGSVKKVEKTTDLDSPSGGMIFNVSRLYGTMCLKVYVSDGTQHTYSFDSSKFENSSNVMNLHFDTKCNDPPVVLSLERSAFIRNGDFKLVSMQLDEASLKNFVATIRKDAANRVLPSMVSCAKRACKEEQYDASYYTGCGVLEPRRNAQ